MTSLGEENMDYESVRSLSVHQQQQQPTNILNPRFDKSQ